MSRRRNELESYHPPMSQEQILALLYQQQLIRQQQYPPMQTIQPRPLEPYRPPHRHKKKKRRESGGTVIMNGFVVFLLSWIPCGMGWPGLTFIVWMFIAIYWMKQILSRN